MISLTHAVCLSILACASAGTIKKGLEGLTTGDAVHEQRHRRNGHGSATLKTQHEVKEIKGNAEVGKPIESGPMQGLEIFQHTMANLFENMPGQHPWRKEAKEKKRKEAQTLHTEASDGDLHKHPFQVAMKEVIRMAVDAKGDAEPEKGKEDEEEKEEREIEHPELVHALLKAASQPWGTIPAGINDLLKLEKEDMEDIFGIDGDDEDEDLAVEKDEAALAKHQQQKEQHLADSKESLMKSNQASGVALRQLEWEKVEKERKHQKHHHKHHDKHHVSNHHEHGHKDLKEHYKKAGIHVGQNVHMEKHKESQEATASPALAVGAGLVLAGLIVGAVVMLAALGWTYFQWRSSATDEKEDISMTRFMKFLKQKGQPVTARLDYHITEHANKSCISDISQNGKRVAFGEFDITTRRTAMGLHCMGLEPGDRVAIVMGPSSEYYTVLVACIKGGYVAAPISPEIHADEEAFKSALSRIEAKVVVCDEDIRQAQEKVGKVSKGGLDSIIRTTRNIGSKAEAEPACWMTMVDLMATAGGSDATMPSYKGDAEALVLWGDLDKPQVSFTQQNLLAAADFWLMGARLDQKKTMAFGDHTDATTLSFFLGTILAGGHFVIPGKGDTPSIEYMNTAGVSHCYVSQLDQAELDISLTQSCLKRCTSRGQKLRTLYVASPSSEMLEQAKDCGVRLQGLYGSAPLLGGVFGASVEKTFDAQLLWKGTAAKPEENAESLSLVSYGTPQCGTEIAILPLEEGATPVVDRDIVGEVCVRGTTVGSISNIDDQNSSGFIRTGDFGFVASVDGNLYIVASREEAVLAKKTTKSAVFEKAAAKAARLPTATTFRAQMADGKVQAVIVLEAAQKGGIAALGVLRNLSTREGIPLGGLAVVPHGKMPRMPNGLVWAAKAKFEWCAGTLPTVTGGSWVATKAKPITKATIAEAQSNKQQTPEESGAWQPASPTGKGNWKASKKAKDEIEPAGDGIEGEAVEVVSFGKAPSAARSLTDESTEVSSDSEMAIVHADQESRTSTIVQCVKREMHKLDVELDSPDRMDGLASASLATLTARVQRALTTSKEEWLALPGGGDSDELAYWDDGIWCRRVIKPSAVMIFESNGSIEEYAAALEKMKFPTAASVGKVNFDVSSLKIGGGGAKVTVTEPVKVMLPSPVFEGAPVPFEVRCMLEFAGTFVTLVTFALPIAVGAANYSWVSSLPEGGWRTFNNAMVLPNVIMAYSAEVIALKWLIVGTYKPAAYARGSKEYLRWWLFDRIVELWEAWAAVWLTETIYLNFIYRMMGANVDMGANVATFVREFDLVTMKCGSDNSGALVTRLVTTEGVIMHRVTLGECATVESKAVVTPNSGLADGARLKKGVVLDAGVIHEPEGKKEECAGGEVAMQALQLLTSTLAGPVTIGMFLGPMTMKRVNAMIAAMQPFFAMLGNEALASAASNTCWYFSYIFGIGFLTTLLLIVAKWILFGRLKEGHIASGHWWTWRVYLLTFWNKLAYGLFISWWMEGTVTTVWLYNAFGASVSMLSGIRFYLLFNPWHADYMTAEKFSFISNALLHPGTIEDHRILKKIHLSEGSFVGLQSIVWGGSTLAPQATAATLSRCTDSLEAGQQVIGETKRTGQVVRADGNSEKGYAFLLYSFVFDIIVRILTLATLVAGVVICTWTSGIVVTTLEPTFGVALSLIPAITTFYLTLLLLIGVVFARLSQFFLHPGREGKVDQLSVVGQLWMHYLQAIYLSQSYVVQAVNGGAMATLLHKMIGAETDMSAIWFSHAIRDHCILKADANAVIDSGAYFVGHVGQPGGFMLFEKTTIGSNACLHPYSILLAGQWLGTNSSLDCRGHCHFDKLITDNMFWTGSPAKGLPVNDCRTNHIRLGNEAISA